MNTLELVKKLRPHLGRRLGDVCPADRLPGHVTDKPKFYVVNTDESRRAGDHWVLFYFPKKKPAEFFDAMGNPPHHYHRRFVNVLMANSGDYSYNRKRLQNGGTCGQFCIYYALNRRRGLDASDILDTFDRRNLAYNDSIVLNFVNTL
ncbi:hypothetical protein BOW28_11745 [Solemya velum gill symbiont]|nr:hypothetical protein BOW28_11745 [Solemya velum gill symbiont]